MPCLRQDVRDLHSLRWGGTDDTYVRLQFKPEERETLAHVKSTVFCPKHKPQLIAIRSRAYMGTSKLARPPFSRIIDKHRQVELSDTHWFVQATALVARIVDLRLCLHFCSVHTLILSRSNTFTWQRDDTSRIALSTGFYQMSASAEFATHVPIVIQNFWQSPRAGTLGATVTHYSVPFLIENCEVTFVTVHAWYRVQVPIINSMW